MLSQLFLGMGHTCDSHFGAEKSACRTMNMEPDHLERTNQEDRGLEREKKKKEKKRKTVFSTLHKSSVGEKRNQFIRFPEIFNIP